MRSLGIRYSWCKRPPRADIKVLCKNPQHFGCEVKGVCRGRRSDQSGAFDVRVSEDAYREIPQDDEEFDSDEHETEMVFEAGEDIVWWWGGCCRSRQPYEEADLLRVKK